VILAVTGLWQSRGDTVEAYFRKKGKMMKPSTQDRTEGSIHEVKGRLKEEVGKLTNDPDLEVSGEAEKNAGKVQNGSAVLKRSLENKDVSTLLRKAHRSDHVTNRSGKNC
jgi:uncharacterized protein YjbJ (UPF0337 family)